MIVLRLEPQELPISGFRIYIECAAEMKDVRLTGMGDVYVNPAAPFVVVVDKSGPTTAYDRVDDREFPEDV